MPYKVAILTISDTASKDALADKSGPLIRQILESKGFQCTISSIAPDEPDIISKFVRDRCRKGDDWIITTGGTGFGVRDKTPEAIRPCLERDAPGLVHLMLAASMKHTPLAALSRPIAGTCGNTLIVTLPGSPKAVKENLDTLLSAGVVEHALDLIKGGSGAKVHSALASPSASASEIGHGHHHYHHHHERHDGHQEPKPRTVLSQDPNLPVSARQRVSPFPLITFDEAIAHILKETPTLGAETRKVMSTLKGHVLAEDVHAPSNVPGSNTTSVDGYALRSTDAPGAYTVLTPQVHSISSPLPNGFIYRVNTGAPLPLGTDTVIMVEDTRLLSTTGPGIADGLGAEEKEVQTMVQLPIGENVRAPGSDVKNGDLVLQRGQILQGAGGEIGTLAFVGRQEVKPMLNVQLGDSLAHFQVLVHRKPSVAIISTGNELTDIQSGPAPGPGANDGWAGIWDTNRPSLQAALENMGYEVIDLGIVTDNVSSHVDAIRKGLERGDIVLATGGTSMGASDLLKPVLERYFGATIHFGRVSVKPGKPTTFATVPIGNNQIKPVFALPGNPASALVTFYLFVVPALRKMGGWPTARCQLPRVRVQVRMKQTADDVLLKVLRKLTEPMKLDARAEFHRSIIRAGSDGLRAFSTGGQRSSRVASLSGANGLIALPSLQARGATELKEGDYAEAILIGEIQMM